MKKLKTFLIALVAMFAISSASAKDLQPLEQSNFLENTYVEAQVGYDWNVNSWHGNGMTTGVRVGKFLTPQFGLELEYNLMFQDFYKSLPGARLGANALLNLNTLGGYTGKQYLVDVTPFVGLGWQRNFHVPSNGLYTKFGVHLDFNTSKHFAIVLTPNLNYNIYPAPMQFNSRRADLGVDVGVKYTFGSFKTCNKKYTQSEYDELLAAADALYVENQKLFELANKPAVVNIVKETLTETIEVPIFPVVGFDCGSAEILPTNQLNINEMASYMQNLGGKYLISGYASMEGPEALNMNLSQERAEALKQALVDAGVNGDNISIDFYGPTEKFGNEYVLNRVAIVTPVD